MKTPVEQIKVLTEAINVLPEMPYIHDDELPLGIEQIITDSALQRSYTLLGKIINNNIEIYEKNDSSGFISGARINDGISTFLDIKTRRKSYPVEPVNLENYHQISMVTVSNDNAERGLAKKTYEFLATKFDLVSDHEQYVLAKKLWKSLARSEKINVYIWDNNDWLRHHDIPKKYNGTNIDDSEIWGKNIKYNTRLLVATKRNL